MNKKIFKSSLGLGTAISFMAPVAAMVSCGSNTYQGRYDTDNDNKLSILTGFSASGDQYKALENLAGEWNKQSGKMQVEITHVEGGYKSIGSSLSNSFEANDKIKVPNMFIGYPDTIGTLAKYEMEQPILKDADKQQIKNLFDQDFLSINDNIGGLKTGNVYSLPIAKSIDMQTINMPVLGMLATEIGVSNIPQDVSSKMSGDGTKVKALWGAKTGDYPGGSVPSWSDITNDAEKMLEFAAKAKPLFPNSPKDTYILGIDSITNFIYQSVFQKTGAKLDKFMFYKASDGYIKYQWDKEGTDARKAFNDVYEKLKAALDAKAVYINTGGAYSSNLSSQHKIAVSYGSTAGYKYNFISGDIPFLNSENNEKINLTSYTDEFVKDNDDTNQIIGTFGKYGTKIFKSTGKNNAGTHDIVLPNAAADTEFNTFITTKQNLYISSNAEASKATNKITLTSGAHPKYLIAADGVTLSDSTLQENEMKILNTPWKFGASSTEAQLVQGPSLIGVHTNKSEDAAMQEFVKWVMTGGSIVLPQEDGTDLSFNQPYLMFASEAGYVVPTKAAFNASATGNEAQKLTFNTLKEISLNQTKHAFDNPVDDTTGNFRNVLDSTISAQYSSSKSNDQTLDAAGIYEAIKRSL